MSLLTIVEASKQFKVGRTTIYKAIKRGDLTPQKNHDGVQVIDAQDMIRVFGSSKKSVSKSVSENSTQPISGNNVNNEDLLRELREQVKELKQDKEFLKQEISSVRKDFEDYKLMISYKGSLSSVETVETVPETVVNSFGEQEKQLNEQLETARNSQKQLETAQNESQIEEKKGFFKRLFGG